VPRKTTIILLSLFVFALGASQNVWAQTPQHQHASANVIDGAVHPELIPDAVAYRLYLVTVSTGPNPTETEQERQHSHLSQTGLDDIDQRMLVIVLSDFKAKYDALVAEYNDSARAALAHNESTDVHVLLNKLDALVQSTRDTISVRLTSRGAAQVHSHVLSEKKNMKVTED
jgi:hypothetical protein